MKFNTPWSPAYRFTAQQDSIDIIAQWGCRHKAGVYVIRNETDTQTLYVGKAENTGCDLQTRLTQHLTKYFKRGGNGRLDARVDNGESFVIRWVESRDPALTEHVVMTAMLPQDNQRMEWASGDRVSYEAYMKEAERLGIASQQPALDRLARWICKDRKVQQKHQPTRKPELGVDRKQQISRSR